MAAQRVSTRVRATSVRARVHARGDPRPRGRANALPRPRVNADAGGRPDDVWTKRMSGRTFSSKNVCYDIPTLNIWQCSTNLAIIVYCTVNTV
jgi:hypothetical protein